MGSDERGVIEPMCGGLRVGYIGGYRSVRLHYRSREKRKNNLYYVFSCKIKPESYIFRLVYRVISGAY